MRIDIQTDGTLDGTTIADADTGEVFNNVRKAVVTISPEGVSAELVLLTRDSEFRFTGELSVFRSLSPEKEEV